MADKMTDSDLAFRALGVLQRNTSDRILRGIVYAYEEQFTFQSTFLDYAQTWSHAHEVVPDLVAKVAAATKEIRKSLQRRAYLVEFPSKWSDMLPCLYIKTQHFVVTRQSKVPTLLHSFARLNEKMELLKQEIRDAYCTKLSGHSFTTQPASCYSPAGQKFCLQVESNLSVLYQKSDFDGSLKKQLGDLGVNLFHLRMFLTQCRSHCPTAVEEQIMSLMAHHDAVAIRAAHLCCLCWAVEMDQNMEKVVSVLVLDLLQKIDFVASPEFLDRMLGFAVNYEVEMLKLPRDWRNDVSISLCKKSFVKKMLYSSEGTVLYDELLLLLNCFSCSCIAKRQREDSDRFSLDIKAVFREAVSCKNRDYRECEMDLAILFARIWFLKAEIFLVWQVYGINLPSIFMDNQIKALHKGSRFLREWSHSPKETTEMQILTIIEEVPVQVESLYQSSEYTGKKVRDTLHKFLVKVMLLKAKKQLVELLNNDASMTVTVKSQIGTLHDGLIFVIASDLNQTKENTEDEKQILITRIEALAAGVIFLCNSFQADKITEEAVHKMNLRLCDLLDMVQILKAKLEEISFSFPRPIPGK